ncbi:MAG: hypothetical protein IKF64_07270 [Eubacterium sp.]|nr:hypothetical protein [Eubacterium sp.]
MKKLKAYISIMLSVLMMISPLNVLTAYADSTFDAKIYNGIKDIFYPSISVAVMSDYWTENSTLTLLRDIDVSESIVVPSGRHILDLNGFGLRASGSDYSVITIPSGSELILNDSGSAEHKYTLDENSLATVNDSAEGDYSTFNGGYITGASGESLEGGAIKNSGTLTMNGGTIIGNYTGAKGGGIFNVGNADINGGKITYNRAIGWGGGIYLSDEAVNTVNLSGGEIVCNGAGNGGGIHISNKDTVNLSGSPIVEDNYSINSNPEYELNNINLAQGGFISVTGALGKGASIGVRSSNGEGVLTNSENTEYNNIAKFTSDNSDYVVGKDSSSGQLKLHTPYIVTWLNTNDSVLETDENVAEGEIPVYNGETPVKPDDFQGLYVFDDWSPEVVAATGNTVYRATFKTVTPVAKIGEVLYGKFENAIRAENWTQGSTLTLLADIDTDATITVPDGAHTIDLNGFGLRASGSDYSVITVPSEAQLTLNDSGNTQHRYTVENSLATVNDSAEGEYSTFSGGYITGASGSSLVGGAIRNSGTFTMNGTTIIGNSAYKGGGIANSGTANINGGQIIYNRTNGWGGGIYLSDTVANAVNLNGGSITNNKSGNGGGIHISENDIVNISGSPIVSDNLSTGNNPNNINLSSNGIIAVTGELSNDALIGVKRSDTEGDITNSENTAYNVAERFVSDNPNCFVGINAESGQLKLYIPYTIIWKNYDGTVLETDTRLPEGDVPNYDGETPTKPDDEEYTYTFEGWTPEVVAATGDAVYTATFTAVPKINTYTVIWQNYDGTVLETDENVEEGTIPNYDGETPTKPDDEHYTYTFDKWSPEISTVSGNVTYTATFTATQFVAKVGDKRFTTLSDAIQESEKAKGGTVITLLADADAPYSMNSLTYDVLRIEHAGFNADITDYKRKDTENNVTYYYRTEDKAYVDGEGDDSDIIEIATGTTVTVIVVGTGVEIVLGSGASVVVEGAAASSVNVDVSDSESECLEEEEQADGSKKYTNHKFHWVTIDTGISILDAASDPLPDCVNDIWATYNQNISTIIKILPPVLTVIGHTDIILKFPYPEGWYFPPIPYLPEDMNPGSHFVAFFEGTSYSTYGTPFLGKTITEDLEITGVWVPYEAAVEKPNGEHIDYYLSFADAASERGGNDNIVRILSAPLFDYTLQKIDDDPVVYEVLKVKRGFYTGTCVYEPDNLPEGYAMRTWTYEDDAGETVTCYTIDAKPTEDAFSLSLDDCIHMNLYLDIKDGENASVTVTYNDPDKQIPTSKTETYSGKELASCRDDEDGRYVIKILAAPAQMRDEVTVEISDGDYSRTFTTSVKDYCEAIIDLYKDSDDEKEQQLVELAKAMLDYGKACSDEFNYNEGAFESQDYINTASVTIPGVIELSGTSGIFKSYSYVAKSVPTLRVYINKTEAQCVADGLVATVTDANGNVREIPPTIVEGTTKVCLDITGILAENFDGTNVIEYDGVTLKLNINQYAKAKGGDLGRSLFYYGVAAKNYFKN